eukprot:6792071-Ditylum_brightwellii.AAC.1
MFKCNDVVSPGILTHIHPTLTCKDDLVESMQEQLKQCKVPNIKVCNQWLKDNAPNHKTEENAPMPEFCIATAKVAWGNGTSQVETTVLKLLCAAKDGLYLKSL